MTPTSAPFNDEPCSGQSQIYDMRILLEEEAARQSARSRQFPDLMRLDALLQRDRELQEPNDHTRITTNLEFHAAVWNCAHNPVLRDLLDRLSTHLIHAPRSTLSTGNRWAESLDEHEALVHAIEQQDSDAAGKIARRHMETARALRLQLLRETALQHPLTNPGPAAKPTDTCTLRAGNAHAARLVDKD